MLMLHIFISALDARHPNFKARFYSHIFFRESTYLQVLIIFYLTGFNGLLFFNGGKETNSSVAVTVKDGALEFCLNCGEKPLCRKAYELKVCSKVYLNCLRCVFMNTYFCVCFYSFKFIVSHLFSLFS